jgi:hypothetical protein
MADTEQTLLALEEEMWRANREGDSAFYDRMLRSDATLVSKYGVATKQEIVPLIQANRNPFIRTALSDQRVIEINAGSALITYRADYTALVEGVGEVDHSVLASSVYAREGDEWKSVFHQQSAL